MIENSHRIKETSLTWLALFTTTGTLVCCALPILLISLGLGATLASLVSAVPVLIILSEQKLWVFSVSGSLLVLSGWLIYRPGRNCPTDVKFSETCSRMQVWNRRVHGVALVLWCIGFFSAFMALPLHILLTE
ncbi:MAG: hypothetical protein JKY50_12465 [Oleispira sp.]|nr:hypothetical protein [Oleispira sp.]MBL4882163.1 hypothetical protein [Oleispira sp.]